jgi:hypothetical protein
VSLIGRAAGAAAPEGCNFAVKAETKAMIMGWMGVGFTGAAGACAGGGVSPFGSWMCVGEGVVVVWSACVV